jgi:hypothetical protein
MLGNSLAGKSRDVLGNYDAYILKAYYDTVHEVPLNKGNI